MRRSHLGFLFLGTLLLVVGNFASADDAKDAAIKKDRQLIEGTWKVVALKVTGDKSNDEDIAKLKVVNGSDGKWKVLSEGKEVAKGTSRIDPRDKPKTIDLKLTNDNDNDKVFLGIYELSENTRKLCIAQVDKKRPTEFSSEPGSEQILVTFERETGK